MHNMRTRRWFGEGNRVLLQVFIVVSLILLWRGADVCTAADGKPVAKVGERILLESDLKESMEEVIPQASFHGTLSPEKLAVLMPKAMDSMIEKELYYQEALSRGMKASKQRINEAKEYIFKKSGGKERFKNILKQWNITEKDYDLKLDRMFVVEDLKKEEIDQKAIVHPEEIQQYYEKNKKTFVRPESRRIRHILIKVDPTNLDDKDRIRKIAEDVIDKLKAGGDFAQLAWDYSEDPYKFKGGDYGLIHKGRLDPDLDSAAFSMKSGEFSGIIETVYGFHIIKVEEIKEPTQLTLDEVSSSIGNNLREERLKERKETFMSYLRAKFKVEIYMTFDPVEKQPAKANP